MPVLSGALGADEPLHESVFSEGTVPQAHPGVRESVRTLDYLYTRYPELGEAELFDMRNDPLQQVNAAERLPEVMEQLGARLDEWREANPIHPDMMRFAVRRGSRG
jgi:hypothetical protein